MNELLISIVAVFALLSCGSNASKSEPTNFPVLRQDGKVAIVAHRGFWECEAAGRSQNSIASLKAAQDNAFWGSECDIHLTADKKVIVNHDPTIDGLKITVSNFDDLSAILLKNGEKRPLFDDYLLQAKKAPKTTLVIEFKKQDDQKSEEELVQSVLAQLKARKMYKPSRVAFISFSHYICRRLAQLCPEFVNQYLEGDIAPAELAKEGINGIDYHYKVLFAHPQWVKEAHDNGMSVNVWTVNKREQMEALVDMGVDAITTNKPLLLREVLADREYLK